MLMHGGRPGVHTCGFTLHDRSTKLQLQLVNVTVVVPDDELQFLTAAFGPNASANSSAWVSDPSAGLGRMDPTPVRSGEGKCERAGTGPRPCLSSSGGPVFVRRWLR